jgi:uncharacterized protein
MIYCDTSLLVPLLVPERFSSVVQDWMAEEEAGRLVVSGWTHTEVASALARKQRAGLIDEEARQRAWRFWTRLLASIQRLPVLSEDYEAAVKLVDSGPRGLRAGDALHLALAVRVGVDLATLDRDLAAAAQACGVGLLALPIL